MSVSRFHWGVGVARSLGGRRGERARGGGRRRQEETATGHVSFPRDLVHIDLRRRGQAVVLFLTYLHPALGATVPLIVFKRM